MEEKNLTLGEKIKTMRQIKGLTAEELGNAVGKDKITIYRYEKGDIKKIPYGVLIKIADCLETSVDYLEGNTDNPKPQLKEILDKTELYQDIHKSVMERIMPINTDNYYQLNTDEKELVNILIDNPGALRLEDVKFLKDSILKMMQIKREMDKVGLNIDEHEEANNKSK